MTAPAKVPDASAAGAGPGILRAVVSGRVQGVGFRFYVYREARRLRLAGCVNNLPDGRVEVYAQGPREDLLELERLLHKGSMLSRVREVEVEWNVPAPPAVEFTIGF